MLKAKRRWMVAGLIACIVVGLPLGAWFLLTKAPRAYEQRRRVLSEATPEQLKRDAQKFVARGLELRNNIENEPRWEAVFSDEEVNAWLAEDLITQFADALPAGVHDPCVAFELDRLTIGFSLDRGPARTVITMEMRAKVEADDTLALTIESVRAGALPVPIEPLLERIAEKCRDFGLDFRWRNTGVKPVALVRYNSNIGRKDVVLEEIQMIEGQIRLAGRSGRSRGKIVAPRLPNRKVLQSTFPRRNDQDDDSAILRNSTSPSS